MEFEAEVYCWCRQEMIRDGEIPLLDSLNSYEQAFVLFNQPFLD